MRPGSSFLSEAGAGKVEVIWAKTPTGWTESESVMLRIVPGQLSSLLVLPEPT